jgi:hypothetical protein
MFFSNMGHTADTPTAFLLTFSVMAFSGINFVLHDLQTSRHGTYYSGNFLKEDSTLGNQEFWRAWNIILNRFLFALINNIFQEF